ncbi:MAG: single-stranded-DNA-specific exonuclease RecJ [Phycisphaeraceae bacterium]
MTSKGMLFRWEGSRSRAAANGKGSDPAQLVSELGVHPLVARLLCNRGLSDAARAEPFLHPRLTDLHDPARMPGITEAAHRLDKAVRDGQPIVIYGDYDVDGVAASTILYHILKLAGGEVHTYIPHRVEEGYGLNTEALLSLGKAHGSRSPLIISVDCGITALEPARAAKDAGIELIITDHHEFAEEGFPDASILVHPRLRGSGFSVPGSELKNSQTRNPESGTRNPYPFPDLCGAGVAFKLAWQFAKVHTGSERVPEAFRKLLLDLLSVAALGTVADVVPLVDENRIITTFGLGQVKRTRFIGLNALIDAANLREEKIDAFHVGFVLGPRLNACGRLGHAADALRLFTTEDESEAKKLADYLSKINDDRRATERAITEQAKQMVVDLGYDHVDRRAIVLGCEGWHTGVIGIVASRLVETFNRPTVMLNFDNGEAHGSARSVLGVSIHEALSACSHHLSTFGGHAMAAGLRMERSRVDAFREELIAFINQKLAPEDLLPVIQIDADCALSDVTIELVQQVQALAPFGRDNPAPVLCVRNVQVAEPGRRIGTSGTHLRLNLRHERCLLQGIGFGLGELAEKLPRGAMVDVVFEPKINIWGDQRRPDMHVKDIRLV